MARKQDVAGPDTSLDDLASEVEGCDPVLLARAQALHDATCEFPWRSATDAHKGEFIRRARGSVR